MACAVQVFTRSAVLALVLTSPSQAAPTETFEAARAAAQTEQPGSRLAFASFSEFHMLTRRWTVLAFYVHWREVQEAAARRRVPIWEVERTRGQSDGETTVDWASSATCPALADRLGQLRALPAPAIQVPGLERPNDTVSVSLDGVGYRLWVRYAQYAGGGGEGSLQLSGNVGSPLASWASATELAMAPCWRPALSQP